MGTFTMGFPVKRLRRLRSTPEMRALAAETKVQLSELVTPLFLVPGAKVKAPILSMPGQFHFSVDTAIEEIKRLQNLGLSSFLLFGIPEQKDETGSAAWRKDGIIQVALHKIKENVSDVLLITDLCFCEYTSHGHCGILRSGKLDNDASLELLAKQALSHAQAGSDMLAPSGMLDGMVKTIRSELDLHGFQDLPIMSYAAKFSSSFYGPFRDAAKASPQHGDRKSYQMNPANAREALREVSLDIDEGADIVMVKPALSFLDIILAVRQTFRVPIAAYNVSGEYSMIKAAAEKGWLNEESAILEVLHSIKRAGADIIITYFATSYAEMLRAKGPFI